MNLWQQVNLSWPRIGNYQAYQIWMNLFLMQAIGKPKFRTLKLLMRRFRYQQILWNLISRKTWVYQIDYSIIVFLGQGEPLKADLEFFLVGLVTDCRFYKTNISSKWQWLLLLASWKFVFQENISWKNIVFIVYICPLIFRLLPNPPKFLCTPLVLRVQIKLCLIWKNLVTSCISRALQYSSTYCDQLYTT